MADTALLVIDVQNDYFPGGKYPLAGMDAAAAKVADLIAAARWNRIPVIHVRHESPSSEADFFAEGTPGAEIHGAVAPLPDEPVVVKHNVNAFLDTGLDGLLKEKGIGSLVIVGAMSHMCVDAATRAALDLGYGVTLAHDATATRDLAFGDVAVPAASVQAALMAALEFAGATPRTAGAIVTDWAG
ncbi:cysteine hydrolase [Starkeya koreensis]|uniref:Cysteine hydrolase n=1 Tax=Ancylobacter koreensis TaxID=266121 RepID=A0ABT0DL83_9HYPH|nr:cysteine hydrolase [Ancylobacter koreensis]